MAGTSSGYQKSQSTRRSRPSSRIDTCSSAKSRTSNSSDRYYNAVGGLAPNATCSSARSHSLPIKPPTRRKPANVPSVNQKSTAKNAPSTGTKNCKCFVNDFSKADSEKVIMVFDDYDTSSTKIPTPAPRKKIKNKECGNQNRLMEHDYLKFSLRIMEDIIRNSLHTNREMRMIFKTHFEANIGHLNKEKMMQQLRYLQYELSIPNESDDENEPDTEEPVPAVKYEYSLSTSKLSPELKCECKVIRRLPFVNQNSVSELKSKSSSSIEPLLQDKNEPSISVVDSSKDQSVDNQFVFNSQPISPCLSNVIEKTEPTSSVETIKDISKNLDDGANKEEQITIMAVPKMQNSIGSCIENIISAILNKIDQETVSPKVLSNASVDPEILSNLSKQKNSKDINQDLKSVSNGTSEKALVLSKSERIFMESPRRINDNYVLISGPIFVPKSCLYGLEVEGNLGITIPKVSEKDRILLISKNVAVNTEAQEDDIPVKQETVSTQCSLARPETADKSLNTSVVTVKIFERNQNSTDVASSENLLWTNSSCTTPKSETVRNIDLDSYDLTPERDDSYKNLNTNLLLGDEYEIQPFELTPQMLNGFYLDDATQTEFSDWTISKGLVGENRDSIKRTVQNFVIQSQMLKHPSSSSLLIAETSSLKEDQHDDSLLFTIKELDDLNTKEGSLNSLREELDNLSLKQNDSMKEIDKHTDINVTRKSNLKHRSSELSITDDEDYKKRQGKGVSIHLDNGKTKTNNIQKILVDSGSEEDMTTVDIIKPKASLDSSSIELHSQDNQIKLDPLDITTSLPELVPQPSVLRTVKRVTRTWEKIRSKKSFDKSDEDARAYSVVDEVFTSNETPNFQALNPNDELKEEKSLIEDTPSHSLSPPSSKDTSCCGLKVKKGKSHELPKPLHSEQVIPIISSIGSDYTRKPDFTFDRELSTSTTSLQKDVHREDAHKN